MCDECGCGEAAGKVVAVGRSVTEANDRIAQSLMHRFKDQGIFCVNIMGSPGSGKTTFIEGITTMISPDVVAVIQGDLESDIDKKRLEKKGIDTFQINTHSGCHLNSNMISDAVMNIKLSGKKYLIIENVGNLVCPAGVKIGQHMNILVSSTTEGSDKPKKYPLVFMDAAMIIISKDDLAQAVGFDEKSYLADIRNMNRKAKILKVSSKDTSSFKEAAAFLEHEREHLLGHDHHHEEKAHHHR